MGLKSVVHVLFAPWRFLWGQRNRFIPTRAKSMAPPAMVKDGEKNAAEKKPAAPAAAAPPLRNIPARSIEAPNEKEHQKVDFAVAAPDTTAFYLHNGKTLRSIGELSEELTHMDPDTYYHHAGSERNDFSNWIRDVFHSSEIADEIRNIHDPFQTRAVIERHRA